MGNEQSNQTQKEFLEKKLDPNYGEVVVFINKTNNQTFTEIKQVFSSDIDCEKLKQSIINRQKLNHRGLVKILSFDKGQMDDLCSSFNVLTVQVEYFYYTLQGDIKQRKIHKTTYTENELLYLIQEMADVCLFMKNCQHEISDIHPQKILIDDNTRQVKYFDQFLETDKISNYFKILFGLRDLEYIAPEQLVLLKGEIRKDNTDQELVNIFCIGLMMVSLMTGLKCVEFFNQETLEYKQEYVNQLLDKYCLRHQFSTFFKQLVQKMLRIHGLDRPGYGNLLELLQPYNNQIAQFLNPAGKQKQINESQFGSFHNSQSSAIKSQVYVPTQFDFSEIDQLIKISRQKAQSAIDEGGLDLKLNNFRGSQINIIEASE